MWHASENPCQPSPEANNGDTRQARREARRYYTYLTCLGQQILNAPNLTLAPQTIFATKLELLIKSLLLIWTPDSLVSLATVGIKTNVRHISL